MNILLVAEGSGGHLIPATEVAQYLARAGARVKIWYARRRRAVGLAEALAREVRTKAVQMEPLPVPPASSLLQRIWRSGQLWSQSGEEFRAFAPHVVVGFGGWMSAPILLAARRRGLGCLIHEQNVEPGRANRLLARWMDRTALSFDATRRALPSGVRSIVTGMPVRSDIGRCTREQGAAAFGLDLVRPTVLVLGGSQGSQVLNLRMLDVVGGLSVRERGAWQMLHAAGPEDEALVRDTYAALGVRASVAAHILRMDAAYAAADLVVARAGASTVAELARAGRPSVLVPFPGARGHQRANARILEAAGGAVVLEQAAATPEVLRDTLRSLLANPMKRQVMVEAVRRLAGQNTTAQLAQAILQVGETHAR